MKRRAFSLLEMMVSLSLFGLALFLLGNLFGDFFLHAGKNDEFDRRTEALRSLSRMASEAQMARAWLEPVPGDRSPHTELRFQRYHPNAEWLTALPLSGPPYWDPTAALETVRFWADGEGHLVRDQDFGGTQSTPACSSSQPVAECSGLTAAWTADGGLRLSLSVPERHGIVPVRTVTYPELSP